MATSASAVLLLGSSSIQSLVPSSLISQVESLLDSHRYEEAIDLADQQLRKLQLQPSDAVLEVEELNYVYQRIGFQCFAETRFDDAGKLFANGNLDPRLLVSYYPGLRGRLFSSGDQVDLFQGVADKMPTEDSVEEIGESAFSCFIPMNIILHSYSWFPAILTTSTLSSSPPLPAFLRVLTLVAANLVRNYSPHLSPNTQAAPGTVELKRVLVMAAEEMLEGFLRRWRGKMGYRYVSQETTKEAKEKDKDRAKAKGKEKAVDPICQVRRRHCIAVGVVDNADLRPARS